jgi:hypothetical protein
LLPPRDELYLEVAGRMNVKLNEDIWVDAIADSMYSGPSRDSRTRRAKYERDSTWLYVTSFHL